MSNFPFYLITPSNLDPDQINKLKSSEQSKPIVVKSNFAQYYPVSIPPEIHDLMKQLEANVLNAARKIETHGYEVELHYDENNQQIIVRAKDETLHQSHNE